MNRVGRYFLMLAIASGPLPAQTEASQLKDLLAEEVLPPDVALYQLRQYILQRVGKLPAPSSAAQWTAESKSTRDRILNDVVFHGWPKDWVNSAPKFEDLGLISGNGYRIRKLRYEIVPGFQSVA